MPMFVQIENVWVNLELVTSVDLTEDMKRPGVVVNARVHFTTGKHQDFARPAEIQALADFLRAHKAP